MNEIFSVTVFTIGLMIIAREIRKPSFGWNCYPFAMIAFWAVMDVSISPYMVKAFDLWLPESYIVQRITDQEYLLAASLLLLWYASIVMGMIIIGHRQRNKPNRPIRTWLVSHNKIENKENAFFKAGLILAIIGLILNLVLVIFFPQNIHVSDISKLRMVYSATRDMNEPVALIFVYIRMFSYIFQLGIVILFFSSRRSGLKTIISLTFAGIGFAILTIFGGRESVVLLALSLLLAWQYGRGKTRIRAYLASGAVAVLFLIVITTVRFGIDNLRESVLHLIKGIFTNHYIDDVNFVISVFPNTLDWLYGKTSLDCISGFFFPGVSFPWFEKFYNILVDNFGVRLYYMSSGVHYSSAAEAYANLGVIGVIGFGILSGIIFGAIFSRQSKQPNDRLFTIFTIMVAVHFFSGLPTKIFQAIGTLGFFSLGPLTITCALVLKQRKVLRQLIFMVTIFAVFYMMYRATGSMEIKLLAALALTIITILSLRYVWMPEVKRSSTKFRTYLLETRKQSV